MQAHAAARSGKALHRRRRASEMFVPHRDLTALGACIPPQMRDRGTPPGRAQGRAVQLILKGPARHLSLTPSPIPDLAHLLLLIRGCNGPRLAALCSADVPQLDS